MSVVLCLPAHLRVSTAASRGRPPTGTRHYVTPAFSGVPNKGEQNQNWLPPLRELRAEMLHKPGCQRVPYPGDHKVIGCLKPTFSGDHKWVEMLPTCHGVPNNGDKMRIGSLTPHFCLLAGPKVGGSATLPCILGGNQQRGQNQNCMPPFPIFCLPSLLRARNKGGNAT